MNPLSDFPQSSLPLLSLRSEMCIRCPFTRLFTQCITIIIIIALARQGIPPSWGCRCCCIMQLATWQLVVAPPRRLLPRCVLEFLCCFLVFEASFMCVSCMWTRTWLERFRFQCVFRFALSLSPREEEEEWSNVRVLFGFDWVNGIQLASGSSRCSLQSLSANLGHVVNWQRLTYCCSTSPSQIQLLFTCAQWGNNSQLEKNWIRLG